MRIIRISIHALRKESDLLGVCVIPYIVISIHALRKESDVPGCVVWAMELDISIHALRKESDEHIDHRFDHEPVRISIHALRKESDVTVERLFRGLDISIHALRKESDHPASVTCVSRTNFNPRSP